MNFTDHDIINNWLRLIRGHQHGGSENKEERAGGLLARRNILDSEDSSWCWHQRWSAIKYRMVDERVLRSVAITWTKLYRRMSNADHVSGIKHHRFRWLVVIRNVIGSMQRHRHVLRHGSGGPCQCDEPTSLPRPPRNSRLIVDLTRWLQVVSLHPEWNPTVTSTSLTSFMQSLSYWAPWGIP